MKKHIVTILIIFFFLGASSVRANREIRYIGDFDNEDLFNTIALIFVLIIVLVFILTMVKRIFDNKIKNRIIDKGISEGQISTILRSGADEENYVNIKWFALMAGIGFGLTIVNYTMPLGIHSLAIMAFSIAFSFLGYHFFLQKRKK